MANTKPNKLKDFPVLIPDENLKIINDMKNSMNKNHVKNTNVKGVKL